MTGHTRAAQTAAVVLAAGRGSRLGAITEATPKPLVPILDRPLLAWLLEDLLAAGLTRAVLNLHHLAGQLESWAAARPVAGMDVGMVTEDRLSGPAGGLAALRPRLAGVEDVVVVSGDACTTVDFGAVLEDHLRNEAALTLVTQPVADPRPFGQVAVAGNEVTGMLRDPSVRLSDGLVSTGMYVVSASALDVLEEMRGTVPDLDFDRHLVPRLLARGQRVVSHRTDAYWNDIGRPESLLAASLHLVGTPRIARAASPCRQLGGDAWCTGDHPPVRGRVNGRIFIGSGVEVPAGAEIQGPAVLGRGTCLDGGTRLFGSVTLPGAQVGPGTIRDRLLLSSPSLVSRPR